MVNAGYNGLAAHNSPSWLSLYLSVCKLLDLALALPAQQLPQFQMYQWAFVSEGNENNNVNDPASSAAGTNGMQFYQVKLTFLNSQTDDDPRCIIGLCPLRCESGQAFAGKIRI